MLPDVKHAYIRSVGQEMASRGSQLAEGGRAIAGALLGEIGDDGQATVGEVSLVELSLMMATRLTTSGRNVANCVRVVSSTP